MQLASTGASAPHAASSTPPAGEVRLVHRARILAAALFFLATLSGTTAAQDLINASPRGLVDAPAADAAAMRAVAARAAAAAASLPSSETAAVPPGRMQAGPLPPEPARLGPPVLFGSRMFTGRFGSEAFSGFNPDYQLAVGDRVQLRMWGAFNFEATQAVDAQGNLFIPNLGPVRVLGVRNADLNRQVELQVLRTFRSNVGVYATLEAAQPVKIYVTGFVRAPGLYPGLSSDSVLYYLDRAGGIDPQRGSYIEVNILRSGKPRATINLYRFLLDGRIDTLQLQDGDTVVVPPRKHTVQVMGEVLNPYIFEFANAELTGRDLLALARPRPGATHLSIVRRLGADSRSEYHALAGAGDIAIRDGDEVTLTADKMPGTILVRVEGAHLGEHTLVLPYGARMQDVLARLRPAAQANIESVQLFRRSVALRQKELMETSLRSLETYALTSRSATSEEAALRGREGQQILEFIDRARKIEPRGQVILSSSAAVGQTLLEDNDLVRIPEASNLVLVSGEVMFPSALVFDGAANLQTYVERAGGFTQGADRARVMVVSQDGSVHTGERVTLRPGDDILVLPKIQAKTVEIARGLTQIIYQIAVAARIALGL